MNKEVTVTGMELRTKVSSNLLVSPDTTEANFQPTLQQLRKALIEPVSTINGVNYDYTLNAAANGAALTDATFATYNEDTDLTAADTNANKTKYDDDFNGAYGISSANSSGDFKTAYGYIDYAFYLKATNTATNASTIEMTKCNLLYNDTPVTEKAWRAALFVQDLGTSCTTGTAPGAANGASLVTILAPASAAYQEDGKGRDSSHAQAAIPKLASSAQVEDSIAVNATQYYYVVVRVWLEGEDTTCTSSTYAALNESWKLDLEFALDGGNDGNKTTAVTAIGSVAAVNNNNGD